MRENLSFHSILEQKIRSQAAHSTSTIANSTVDQDPAHLAFLLGTLHRSSFQTASSRVAKSYPAPPKPVPRPHVLTSSQADAVQFFSENGLELSPAFTRKELRTAFRQLALRLHPDTNKGTSGPFIALKTHFEELSKLFAVTE